MNYDPNKARKSEIDGAEDRVMDEYALIEKMCSAADPELFSDLNDLPELAGHRITMRDEMRRALAVAREAIVKQAADRLRKEFIPNPRVNGGDRQHNAAIGRCVAILDGLVKEQTKHTPQPREFKPGDPVWHVTYGWLHPPLSELSHTDENEKEQTNG